MRASLGVAGRIAAGRLARIVVLDVLAVRGQNGKN